MGECVGVFQEMGDEVAVLAIVIEAAAAVVFASHQRCKQQSAMRVWADGYMCVCESVLMCIQSARVKNENNSDEPTI